MKRTAARLAKDRADLLAALQDAERPITAPALVAAVHGYTLDTIPDRVLFLAMRYASTDLRALARAGALVLDTRGFVATYTRVDLPGSELAEQQAEDRIIREDWRDLERQVRGWEPAE